MHATIIYSFSVRSISLLAYATTGWQINIKLQAVQH